MTRPAPEPCERCGTTVLLHDIRATWAVLAPELCGTDLHDQMPGLTFYEWSGGVSGDGTLSVSYTPHTRQRCDDARHG